MRYLLDTTLLADHANGYAPATALLERLYEEGHDLFTCDVVTCEALSGGTDEYLGGIRALLAPLEFVSTTRTRRDGRAGHVCAGAAPAESSASGTP